MLSVALIGLIIISSIVIEYSGPVFEGPVFKSEGENWKGELVTSYNLKGEEFQRIKISYIGENPKQLKENNVNIDSSDFLGWGITEIELDEHGNFDSGESFKLDSKTSPSALITLTIEGKDSEVLLLSSNS